jgi:uncharacterized damage-inducible protein DinB
MASEKRVQTLIDKLASARGEILQTIEGLDEGVLTWDPEDGRWSIKETLAHLASAEGSHRQVDQAIAVGQTVDVPDFDLDAWNAARVAEGRQRSTDEILEEMAAERRRTLSALQDLGTRPLTIRVCTQPWAKPPCSRCFGSYPSTSGGISRTSNNCWRSERNNGASEKQEAAITALTFRVAS